MQNYNKIIGNNLKTERCRKDISIEKLAKMLGTTPVSLSKWENGITKIPVVILIKSCKLLNCDFEAFLVGIDNTDSYNE